MNGCTNQQGNTHQICRIVLGKKCQFLANFHQPGANCKQCFQSKQLRAWVFLGCLHPQLPMDSLWQNSDPSWCTQAWSWIGRDQIFWKMTWFYTSCLQLAKKLWRSSQSESQVIWAPKCTHSLQNLTKTHFFLFTSSGIIRKVTSKSAIARFSSSRLILLRRAFLRSLKAELISIKNNF